MNKYIRKITTFSPEETVELGRRVGALLRKGDIVAYRGGLGAGKTTMTRGIALGMGIKGDVSSPTFALVNEYAGPLTLCHFDMYRVTGGLDLESTGFYDYMSDGCVLAVEWSENIADELPDSAIIIDISLSEKDSDGREITVIGDDRFADF